jgi:hypothetical protein
MNVLQKALLLGFRLGKIALTNPSRLSHVLGTALAVSTEVVDRSLDLRRFKMVTVEELIPEGGPELPLDLRLFPNKKAAVSALEMVCLAVLMKKIGAKNVFEFGTYKGVSTTQFALNVPKDGRVLTLDLPDEPTQNRFPINIAKDAVIARESGKGGLVPPSLRDRVTFLREDSAKFEELPYAGQIDFVFVDGAHNTEYVRNDTEKGWRMLRSGGIIAWHDCVVNDPDVVRFLLNSPYQPTRILGTSLAFAVKP